MFTLDAATEVRNRAVDATALAYLHVDRAGMIRDWNPAAERLFGWTRSEIIGRRLADTLVPAGLRSAYNAAFARRLVTGDGDLVGSRVEVPAVHRDGGELQITINIDELGADGFFAYVSDRTDWHRAQQELQRSTTLITAILQHTTAVVFAKDLQGRYLFVNGEYERVFQVAAADAVGRLEAEVLPAAVAAVGRAHDEQVARTGVAGTAVEEVPTGDDLRQYLVTRVPLTEPDGTVYGICTIAIDDTARRRSEAALAAREKQFWTTVNNAPGMLYQFRTGADGDSGFTFVSEGCRDIFGLEPGDLITSMRRLSEVIAPEDLESYLASVQESARTLQPWSWRGSMICRDGSRRWLYGVSRPHREPDGSIIWDGMMLDRTRERHTEADLAELRREMTGLTEQLAVLSLVTGADTAPAPALTTLVEAAEHETLDRIWAAAREGKPADMRCARADGRGRLWVRLRPRVEDGEVLIEVACFDLGRMA
ncbi:PAS domain-containing protein [Actinoplanes rectilineatus]|uniref:PAS domain-containing protein n=1 Tax=Actinoplanes rectilineatus TaxID=113571 RepID=UPI0009FB5605|nr:PAS domain S-box protein [Actinoplanes rectilineatus]